MCKTFFKVMAFIALKALWIVAYIAIGFIVVFAPGFLAMHSRVTAGWDFWFTIALYVLEILMYLTVRKAIRVTKYIHEHNCSIKEAWEATAPEPDNDDEY